MKPVIAVDVDLTVVDSLTPWLNWIRQKTKERFDIEKMLTENDWDMHYQAMPEYHNVTTHASIKSLIDSTVMEFWKQPELYQFLAPLPGAVNAIRRLSLSFDIVFVSHCFPEHMNSKLEFIRSYFGYKFPLIATSDKQFVDYDIIIDDTPGMINKCAERNPDRMHIGFPGVFFGLAYNDVLGYMLAASDAANAEAEFFKTKIAPKYNTPYVAKNWEEIFKFCALKSGESRLTDLEKYLLKS